MTFNCDEKLPGVAEIDFLLLEEVSNWPIKLTDANASQLVLSPSVHSVQATIKPDSIAVSDNKSTKPNGIVHSVAIKMEFHTRSEALEQLLEQYQNLPGIVVAKFNNGFRKIYGSIKEPLYLIYEDNPGSKIDGDAVTSIEIKGETASRPVFYTV